MSALRGSERGGASELVVFGAPAALLVLGADLSKVAGQPAMREAAADHFSIAWDRDRAIGVAEIAAALGVIVGLWRHGLGLAAGAGVALLMAGCVAFHLRLVDSAKALTPLLLAFGVGYAATQAAAIWG